MKLHLLLTSLTIALLPAQSDSPASWKFAVSGDSRNCGAIVMPAIAASVLKSNAVFYWHLGDYRAIYDFDEDTVPPATLALQTQHLTISSYLQNAWPDFIKRQLGPFGNLEIFLAIGNHETIPPKNEDEYLKQFASYLDSPRLRAQRQQDGDPPGPRTYYHWIMNHSVDFITLDNAVNSTFDEAQMRWVRKRLQADAQSSTIRTIVVGMHEALPGSKSSGHSMCESKDGIQSGREVYESLWNLQQRGKKVYALASHSHFVMDDIYRTPYWGSHVIPGWIVGTAGAVRYRIPPGITAATIAKTDVEGYLLGTVNSDGSVDFKFEELTLDDLRKANAGKSPDSLVKWCYSENANQRIPTANACSAQ